MNSNKNHATAALPVDSPSISRPTAQPPRILVGICTCAAHAERKKAVRDTWLRHIPDGIRCIFFTGRTATEAPAGPDTVILPVDDNYKTLPQKTFSFLCHALENEEFDWLFKCDDDTYVALDRLASIIRPECDIIGNPMLRSRHAPSGGAGYMLSRRIVEKIVSAGAVPPTGAEDLIIGHKAINLGAVPHATDRLCHNNKRYPLPSNDTVTSHWCGPERLRAVDAFYRTPPLATFHGRHAHWNDTVHFHPGGYYRRTAACSCGTYRIENGTNLILNWFDWPEEHLANINGTYTSNKLALRPVSGSLQEHETGHPEPASGEPLYIQLGCGKNRLQGWMNLDMPVFDITRPLPWNDQSVDALFLEHVIEHIPTNQAYAFMKEAWRTLKPGGILRLTFPDLLRISRESTPEYIRFLQAHGWGNGTPGSALESIITNHGHKAIWTRDTMLATLRSIGFEASEQRIGESPYPHIRHLDQRNHLLGPVIYRLETTCIEAVKPDPGSKTMKCVFLIAPHENMEGQSALEHLGNRIVHYPVTPEQHLTDERDQEFTSFLGRPPATSERRHVRSLRQSFANMLLDPSWDDDDCIIFGESDSTPLIDAATLSGIVRQELRDHPEADVIRLFHRLQTNPALVPPHIGQPAFEPYRTGNKTLHTPYVWGTHALIIPARSRRKVAELFTTCRLPIDTTLEMAQSKNELNIRVSLHDYFYQKKRTARQTPQAPRQHRIAVCLASYKRYEDLQRQIYCIMTQSYENYHLFVAVKGISEWAYINTVLPNFRHWIEEGRITMRYYPNKNQLSNVIDTVRDIDISEYDLFAKIDDDDFYSRDYLKTVNDFHNTIPEGNSSYYSAFSPIRYAEKGHVCFRIINYTVFGASMVLGKTVMQALMQCETSPEQEIPKILARNPQVKRTQFGFAEDHLFHILMEEHGCNNRAEYVRQHCTHPHIIVQKSNKSVMRGGLLDQQFIARNRIVSSDPANHEHILELHHPEWHDLLQILGNRATRITRDDHASVIAFTPDRLTIRWDQWGEETYLRQPSGFYLLQRS